VGIGENLAEARRQAGLTVTQVSQRTCIRETIIVGIERDDYCACGGDFYARGHIRAIAQVVRADPGPLIAGYDAAHPAQPVTAADILRPGRPVRLGQRHRLNWPAVLGLALVIVLGLVAYHVIAS
jgi:cytoskeletal protein RodZ